jgi:hypothetical protein
MLLFYMFNITYLQTIYLHLRTCSLSKIYKKYKYFIFSLFFLLGGGGGGRRLQRFSSLIQEQETLLTVLVLRNDIKNYHVNYVACMEYLSILEHDASHIDK